MYCKYRDPEDLYRDPVGMFRDPAGMFRFLHGNVYCLGFQGEYLGIRWGIFRDPL